MSELEDPEHEPDKEIPKEVQEILDNPSISEEQRKTLVEFTHVKSSTFSGPLPPPEILEHYNGIIENGAERIMKMAENQAAHRMGLEKKAITSQLSQSKKGQIFGFIIALILIGSSVYLAATGHEGLAKVLGGSTILGLVAIFVTGKILQRK